jgi:transposase
VAARFDVGVASVTGWIKNIHRKPQGFRRGKIDLEALRRGILDYPDAYQFERAKRLGVTQNAISLALRTLPVTYKKALRHPRASESARLSFQETIRAYETVGRTIVYIDESGFAHDMPPMHGYAPMGQRCYGVRDWHAKGRTNVIGALIGECLHTIGLFKTSINADVLYTWTVQDLLPKLPPACVIVMDNAAFHKRQDIQDVIAEAGRVLEYLPAYSPDLNLIEHKWAQSKALRRTFQCSIESLFNENTL